ncbi:MAG: lytic transglycosylase domain-containing protein [Pseudomonadota bacterium]|nr:lytic transglycosylase domain-containing protein [Pseudomonadota bacterium]
MTPAHTRPGLPCLRAATALRLCAALLLPVASAHADLWGYMDEAGITHFAATQVDVRYQLFYKGADLARLDLGASALGLVPASSGATGLRPSGFEPPRRFKAIDYVIGYKAVRHHIRAAAKAHKVDYALIKAVIAAESGFDPQAVSPKGAVGLMQLLPSTASQYGVVADAADPGSATAARTAQQKLTDPRTNIFAGARHLAYLMHLFEGNTELAVAAYNAGQGAVRRAGNQVPGYKETQHYVKTVMGLYGLFQPAAQAAERAAAAPLARAVNRAPMPAVDRPARPGRMVSGRIRVNLVSAPQAPLAPMLHAEPGVPEGAPDAHTTEPSAVPTLVPGGV